MNEQLKKIKAETSGDLEVVNDLTEGPIKAVRLPDGRYVTEKLARETGDLENAAEEYANSIAQFDMQRIYSKDDFIAGANWQKEQMLREAVVDGRIVAINSDFNDIAFPTDQFREATASFKEGDKVKLIIVKED